MTGLVEVRDCMFDAPEDGGVAMAAAATLPPGPERRTRLVHTPITVSLIGSWSTRKPSTGSCKKKKKRFYGEEK